MVSKDPILKCAQTIVSIANGHQGKQEYAMVEVPLNVVRAAAMIVNGVALQKMGLIPPGHTRPPLFNDLGEEVTATDAQLLEDFQAWVDPFWARVLNHLMWGKANVSPAAEPVGLQEAKLGVVLAGLVEGERERLQGKIDECSQAIAEGSSDPWYREDLDRFRHTLRILNEEVTALATPARTDDADRPNHEPNTASQIEGGED